MANKRYLCFFSSHQVLGTLAGGRLLLRHSRHRHISHQPLSKGNQTTHRTHAKTNDRREQHESAAAEQNGTRLTTLPYTSGSLPTYIRAIDPPTTDGGKERQDRPQKSTHAHLPTVARDLRSL